MNSPDSPAATAAPSALLSRPGAVAADGLDAGVAWHYGDPMGEQRAAEQRVALLDLSHRRVLRVTGPDRLTWLHTLTSQALGDAADGSTTQALLLSPQGHVEHHMGVTDLTGVTYLDVAGDDAQALLDYLQRMVFWSKVEVVQDDSLAQLRVTGPLAGPTVVGSGLTDSVQAVGAAGAIPHGFARTPGGRAAGAIDLFVPRADVGQVAAAVIAAGARPAGSWAAAALRVAARDPRHGLDSDARTIPNELSWLEDAVHLAKGCYRGQETVARVHNIGRPPRRLVMLNLDGSVDRLPEPGSQVLTGAGRVVGRVGTAVQHHELGPVALALVKRGVPADAPLLADGVDAAIDPDDLVDAGPGEAPPRSAIDRRQFIDVRRS